MTGSHKTWGGWETRRCWQCGNRIVLTRGSAQHCHPIGGQPFSLCDQCFGCYSTAWRANAPAEPAQVELEEELLW